MSMLRLWRTCLVSLAMCGLYNVTCWAQEDELLLAVIVPVTAQIEPLTQSELALIYRRKKTLWNDGQRIVPVNYPADNAQRKLFSEAVLEQSPESQDAYWNQQYFQGVLPPHVLDSETAMLRFVVSTPGAIGYMSHCAVDQRVRILMLIKANQEILRPDLRPRCP